MAADEFEQVRRERDPLRQAQRATDLLATYQQRGVELARLRRDAVERAADELGLSYSAVAARIGLSKGRITQIRQSAPPAERGFFGVGPLTVAVPLRAMPDRPSGVIAHEDALALERLTGLLTALQFQVRTLHIPPDGVWRPPPEAIAICGPKSSDVTAEAIASDPHLTFDHGPEGHWSIRDKTSDDEVKSPMDEGIDSEDVAYVGRLRYQGHLLFVIAGIHALGSLGAVDYLTANLRTLYATVGQAPFSLVVRSTFDGTTVTKSEALWGPRAHA